MLTSSRSFEAIREATRRDHLMPVESSDTFELTWLALIWLVAVPVCVAAYWFWRAM